MDPVRIIATIIVQLIFLEEHIKNRGAISRAIDLQHRYAKTIETKFMINLSLINQITNELPLKLTSLKLFK